jgi:hypothetical protein
VKASYVATRVFGRRSAGNDRRPRVGDATKLATHGLLGSPSSLPTPPFGLHLRFSAPNKTPRRSLVLRAYPNHPDLWVGDASEPSTREGAGCPRKPCQAHSGASLPYCRELPYKGGSHRNFSSLSASSKVRGLAWLSAEEPSVKNRVGVS